MENLVKLLYSKFIESHQNICTDTRKISDSCIYFALRGENFNGNDFATDALNKGAAYAVVDDQKLEKHEQFIFTKDVLSTLQELAALHRNQLKTKIIALTGSNGKTTTKELMNVVLNKKFKTHATQGNLNNHIGVPLTLLSLTEDAEFAVVEMGANHQKEIEVLCNIAQPQYGLITNVGKAHLEGFGGFEGVIKGKNELYDYLKKSGGKIFINTDNAHLRKMCGNYKNIFSYGTHANADCKGVIVNESPFIKISWQLIRHNEAKDNIQSNLAGSYNFENILAAVCIGNYFGIENKLIKQAIENYFPSNQRSQVVVKNSNTFIMDYYNANPSSIEAALLNFEKNYPGEPGGKKIAVLGDMLELGAETQKEHDIIIQLLKKLNFQEIILVGEFFLKFSGKINARFFKTSPEANEYLKEQNFKNCVFLIKGSRGLKMEKAVEGLA